MQNLQPEVPELINDCPVTTPAPFYYTSKESVLNTSRKDKFILVIDLPPALKPYIKKFNKQCFGGDEDRLKFSVWGAVIPETASSVIEHSVGGQTFKFSGNNREKYEAITCNFTVDNNFENYFILRKWLDLQNDSLKGGATNCVKNYSTAISLYVLNEYDQPTVEFIYSDAFVTKLGGIEVNRRDAEESETTFTFEFSQLSMNLK
jgi:hypothetical protein